MTKVLQYSEFFPYTIYATGKRRRRVNGSGEVRKMLRLVGCAWLRLFIRSRYAFKSVRKIIIVLQMMRARQHKAIGF